MADVSVVIPCYNGERFIAQTIESVLNQTDPPREVFVIDDGSTDNSAAIIEKYTSSSGDCRVVLIRQANAGESRARNVGIEQSTCGLIALLDADDVWMPEKTARQLEMLEQHPDAAGVHTRVFNFENDLDDRSREETERTKDDPSVEDLISYHYISPSTVMLRREMVVKHGLRFEESIRHSEDMLFLADVRLTGRLRLVNEPLVAKRIHSGQQTKNPWHPIYSLENRVHWCRRHSETSGDELFKKLDHELGKQMVGILEDRYWRRQVCDLHKMKRRVADLFPELVAQSDVLNRRIYPRWVYRLRDTLTGGSTR